MCTCLIFSFGAFHFKCQFLKQKINITYLGISIVAVMVTVSFRDFNGFPPYHKKDNKPFQSLNHLILCLLLVFHLGVMACEICTMMRKQLGSTPVVYSHCVQGGPAGAVILFHSMVSSRGLSEVT